MEALLKAVKKSPRPFSRPNAGKHKKLSENVSEVKQPVKEGVSFYVKHLGSTLVEELDDGQSYGDAISSEAVKTIVNMAKMSGKKLDKMCITVSINGIQVTNMVTKEVKTDISIYRICFCTADRNHDKVFAYIARNTDNETMECQAFLCPKRKIAQAVTLTVAQCFSSAQEEWEEKERRDRENKEKRALSESGDQPQFETLDVNKLKSRGDNSTNMVDLTDKPAPMDTTSSFKKDDLSIFDSLSSQNTENEVFNPFETTPTSTQKSALGFDDDFSVEDDFSSLAQSRSQVQSANQANILSPTSAPAGLTPMRPNPFGQFSTSLRPEDLEDGVGDLLSGQRNSDELTRVPSMDDLLSL